MKQETETALNECIATLSKLLDFEDPQIIREGTLLLKTFDLMLMTMQTYDQLYAGVLQRALQESNGEISPNTFNEFSMNQQRPPAALCNCGLSKTIDEVKDSPFFGKKICDATCRDSEQKAKGDVSEYIKFLSEENENENQTEEELNAAVTNISDFVDEQLGILKPNQPENRSGEIDIAHGKGKVDKNK